MYGLHVLLYLTTLQRKRKCVIITTSTALVTLIGCPRSWSCQTRGGRIRWLDLRVQPSSLCGGDRYLLYDPKPDSRGKRGQVSFMRMSEALEKYEEHLSIEVKPETAKRMLSDMRILCIFLKDKNLKEIKIEEIIEHLRLMKKMDYSQNGLYKKAIQYRNFFEFVYRRGWCRIHKGMIPIPPREYNPPRVATKEEYEKILSVVEKKIKSCAHKQVHVRNYAIIRLLWDTGMRNGEACSLNIDNPQEWEHGGMARINTEKSRGSVPFRQVFWNHETHKALKKWMKERESYKKKHELQDPDALFIGTNGRVFGKRISNHALSIAMRKYSKKAGIPTLNPHSFRHRKGRYIVELGGSGADVMNILGHSKLESSKPYVQLWGKDLEGRAEKFLDL